MQRQRCRGEEKGAGQGNGARDKEQDTRGRNSWGAIVALPVICSMVGFPCTFRISCDWRAGGHSGGQAATSHTCHGGNASLNHLGGGQARPTLLSLLLKCHAYCLCVSFRFQFCQTVRGTHNQKPVQRIPHILRSTPRQSQGGGELPF